MSGLFSSLALSGALAASVLGSPGTAPEAPVLSSQESMDSSKPTALAQQSSDSYVQDLDNGDMLAGIDISSNQHIGDSQIDLEQTLSNGKVKFGFVKATEGTGYVNPNFRDDFIDFIRHKNLVGSYHFAKPSSSTEDAKKQARLYMSVTGMAKGVKTFDPVLDIERSEGLSPNELQDWVSAFVDEIKDKTGRDTIIYTYPSFWRNDMGDTTKFNHLPLWIADYNGDSSPSSLPGGWDKWLFWQYTPEGKVDGYDHHVDLNIYNGSQFDLNKLYYSKKKIR